MAQGIYVAPVDLLLGLFFENCLFLFLKFPLFFIVVLLDNMSQFYQCMNFILKGQWNTF